MKAFINQEIIAEINISRLYQVPNVDNANTFVTGVFDATLEAFKDTVNIDDIYAILINSTTDSLSEIDSGPMDIEVFTFTVTDATVPEVPLVFLRFTQDDFSITDGSCYVMCFKTDTDRIILTADVTKLLHSINGRPSDDEAVDCMLVTSNEDGYVSDTTAIARIIKDSAL